MIEDATRVALSDEDRAALSARLGVALHLIPTHKTACPPRTFSINAAETHHWKVQGENKSRIIAYNRRMAALKARENYTGPVAVQREGSKPRYRPSRAKPKPEIARTIIKAHKVQRMRQPTISERDLRIAELLCGGMSHRAVCDAVGLKSKGSLRFIIRKLRDAGHLEP